MRTARGLFLFMAIIAFFAGIGVVTCPVSQSAKPTAAGTPPLRDETLPALCDHARQRGAWWARQGRSVYANPYRCLVYKYRGMNAAPVLAAYWLRGYRSATEKTA